MSLPGRVLMLGSNMDEPFPEALRELRDTDLVALFERFGPALPGSTSTGAGDRSVFE